MKRRHYFSTALLMFVLFASFLQFGSLTDIQYTDKTYHVSAQTASSPIIIDSEDDFSTLGIAGSGSLEDPYLIQGLLFESLSNDSCISICHVNSYVLITDCVFSFSNPSGRAINLYNGSNCMIIDCDFSCDGTALFIDRYQLCYADAIDCQTSRIYASNSNSVILSNCSLENVPDDAIALTKCTFSQITNCSISGCTASGIAFYGTNYSSVMSNIIQGADLYSIILIEGSSYNFIIGNFIYSAGVASAYDGGLENDWDDGDRKGNWWEDYSGEGVYIINGPGLVYDRFPNVISLPTTPNTNEIFISLETWEAPDFNTRVLTTLGVVATFALLILVVFYIRFKLVKL
ncbi:MAG: hypothetical protein GF411_20595 [Candidatus Lokiarchaeota archaeon]|nr:hypothetical protein [Candidatus Lokiarchaeota archaeon]